MNGPEHYREAERLLEVAAEDANIGSEEERYSLAAAQVHATLAQADATALLAQTLHALPTYEGMLAVYNFGGQQ